MNRLYPPIEPYKSGLLKVSDLHDIYTNDLKYFKKLKFLVIDCLRYSNHPAHLNFDACIKLIKYLTNILLFPKY